MPETSVGAGCGLFDKRKRFDELREVADRHTRDREVLDGSQRMNAPVSLGRNIDFAQEVVLASESMQTSGGRSLFE